MADNSNSNSFLKNLSQKKYAWMQTAPAAPQPSSPTAPTIPLTPTNTPASPSPPSKFSTSSSSSSMQDAARNKHPEKAFIRKIKKQKLSPESESSHAKSPLSKSSKLHSEFSPLSSLGRVETTPSHNDSPVTETEQQVEEQQEEQQAKPLEQKPQIPQPKFKYTTFPVRGFNILPTRNITSNFAKNDVTYFPGNKAGSEVIAPNPEEEWRDTIIIHPGSRTLRVGLASEAFPISVPHVIARRLTNAPKPMDTSEEEGEEDERVHQEALAEIKGELKWRMKNAKRRAVPNAEGQVTGFNSTAVKETIPDHNDPYKVEWTEVPKRDMPEYYVGEKALNLPINEDSSYRLFYPWKYGTLNNQDYTSVNAILGDIQVIWTEAIKTELEIEEADFKNYNAVLVIPDLYNRTYLSSLTTLLLRFMKFRGIFVQQESICATFGAGVSSAVVVDIGAQKTNIACIEEGVCQVDSRICIAMGGDDITRTFTSFLHTNKFPYAQMDLDKSYDWRLADELKQRWCTMNEADISVQVYDFFARTPFTTTIKYQCKVYDEVFLAPLCLMYPAILNAREKSRDKKTWTTQYVTDDVIEDYNLNSSSSATQSVNNPSAGFQKAKEMDNTDSVQVSSTRPNTFDVFPLDIAIAQSIQAGANGSEERLKRFFTSIILVGGGGLISNFSRVLEDRVLSTVIAQRASIERVEVLPAPRELDPQLLVWKGASVMSKLDTAKDMWIGAKEWEETGARCFRERALIM